MSKKGDEDWEGPHVTVAELIEKLSEIEDKTQQVYVDGNACDGVEIYDDNTGINIYSDPDW